MNSIPTPKTNFKTASNVHEALGRKEKFLAVEHMCRHPFVQKLLYTRQHGKCACCRKQISNLYDTRIHHKSYNIYCQFLSITNPEIRVSYPRGNGKFYATVPNCELCYFSSAYVESSERCINNLALLCSQDCHDKVHNIK